MKSSPKMWFRSALRLSVFFNLAIGSLFAQSSLRLGWDPGSGPMVVGYRLHYGAASRNYTNSISCGLSTSIIVSNLNPGSTYYFAVGAYGAQGIEGPLSTELGYTAPLARPIDPTVMLTSPTDASSFAAPAAVALSAAVVANGHSVAKVQFYNALTLLGESTVAPYSFAWSGVPAGNYSLKARLVYDSGTLDSVPITVTVSNPPPLITISSPTDGAVFTSRTKVSFAASVVANGHLINKVGFYDNATLLKEQTSAPFFVTLQNPSGGKHVLTARATYDATDSAARSATITVVNTRKSIASIAADAGAISAPFATLDGALSQNQATSLLDGGRAVYNFAVPESGDYMLSAWVTAPSASENSFYVNVDSEPQDPAQIWNLSVATDVTEQPVTWPGVSASVPKVFFLTAGSHQLIVRGRDPDGRLGTISVWAAPFDVLVTPVKQAMLSGVGQAGHTYDIQATRDFRTWTTIGSVTLAADGSFQFVDPSLANAPVQSYRLVIH